MSEITGTQTSKKDFGATYPAPLNRLLEYGPPSSPDKKEPWRDYVTELGLDQQHIPDLIPLGNRQRTLLLRRVG
jgi:hypothetical protein